MNSSKVIKPRHDFIIGTIRTACPFDSCAYFCCPFMTALAFPFNLSMRCGIYIQVHRSGAIVGTKWRKRCQSQYTGAYSGTICCARRGSFPQLSLLSRHESLAQSHLISHLLQVSAQFYGCACLCCPRCCQICCDSSMLTYSLFFTACFAHLCIKI